MLWDYISLVLSVFYTIYCFGFIWNNVYILIFFYSFDDRNDNELVDLEEEQSYEYLRDKDFLFIFFLSTKQVKTFSFQFFFPFN
jgi:hypothetical protein